MNCFYEIVSAEQNLKKHSASYERFKKTMGPIANDASSLSYSLHQALGEVNQAERKLSNARSDFEDVGKLIKAEIARFHVERVQDMQSTYETFVTMISDAKTQACLIFDTCSYELMSSIVSERLD